jgi:hypothetical protein
MTAYRHRTSPGTRQDLRQSTSSRLHGAGSIATMSGRVKLVNDTSACPGARRETRFQRLSSMLPNVRCTARLARARAVHPRERFDVARRAPRRHPTRPRARDSAARVDVDMKKYGERKFV